EVLRLPDETVAGAAAPARGSAIEMTAVRFGYAPGREVVRGLSLAVAPGEHGAVGGRTGAGKTSALQPLAGLYTPWHGTVAISGVDPRGLAPEARRRLVGVVPQSTQLFGASVLDNLTLGDPGVTRAAVERALALVGAEGFVGALPDGFDTVLRG